MEEDKGKKKYRYTYYTATGKEEIGVDENWYEILRQADKDMYNNNRREEYKSYHLNSYVDDDSGEEHDAWETVADKETVQLESDICATMDENWVLDCLSKRNKYIYEKCVVEGVSQSAVAKELGLTQSSVSRRLIKILHPKNNVCAEKDYPIILKNFSKF
jgi:DNA-directed RNA polymerase specialized sigma subunit